MRGRDASDDSTDRWSRQDWWGVVLEAPDAAALARFYAEVLGWEVASSDPAGASIGPADGVAYLAFQTCPGYVRPVWPLREGDQQMMMHLDFQVSDLPMAVGHALELGAQEADFQPQSNVRVMLDPAGHPFCLYLTEEDPEPEAR